MRAEMETFNQTSVELKQDWTLTRYETTEPFNQTSVELKHIGIGALVL